MKNNLNKIIDSAAEEFAKKKKYQIFTKSSLSFLDKTVYQINFKRKKGSHFMSEFEDKILVKILKNKGLEEEMKQCLIESFEDDNKLYKKRDEEEKKFKLFPSFYRPYKKEKKEYPIKERFSIFNIFK